MPTRPTRTAADDHRSELKCSASASSAGLAGVDGDLREHAGAEEVDHDRGDDDAECEDRRLDGMRVIADQPLARFPHHHAGQDEQQRGLGEGGDVLDLAVAVLMVLIRRLVGPAHGEVGHHRGGEVDQRMGRLGEDRQRAGQHPDHGLAEGQGAGGGDRAECDTFLQARHATSSGREFDSHCDYSRTAGRADDGRPPRRRDGKGRDQAGRMDGL